MARTKSSQNGSPAITPQDFVRAWQSADSVADVCEKLGLERKKAMIRYYGLVKKGVNLKKFGDARHRINVDELNEIAAEAT